MQPHAHTLLPSRIHTYPHTYTHTRHSHSPVRSHFTRSVRSSHQPRVITLVWAIVKAVVESLTPVLVLSDSNSATLHNARCPSTSWSPRLSAHIIDSRCFPANAFDNRLSLNTYDSHVSCLRHCPLLTHGPDDGPAIGSTSHLGKDGGKIRSGQYVLMKDLLADNMSLCVQLETLPGPHHVYAGLLKPRL